MFLQQLWQEGTIMVCQDGDLHLYQLHLLACWLDFLCIFTLLIQGKQLQAILVVMRTIRGMVSSNFRKSLYLPFLYMINDRKLCEEGICSTTQQEKFYLSGRFNLSYWFFFVIRDDCRWLYVYTSHYHNPAHLSPAKRCISLEFRLSA